MNTIIIITGGALFGIISGALFAAVPKYGIPRARFMRTLERVGWFSYVIIILGGTLFALWLIWNSGWFGIWTTEDRQLFVWAWLVPLVVIELFAFRAAIRAEKQQQIPEPPINDSVLISQGMKIIVFAQVILFVALLAFAIRLLW